MKKRNAASDSTVFLHNIGFDSSVRLPGNVYYFEYQGFRFKLVQHNPRKYSNHLLTIVPSIDRAGRGPSFKAAAGFLSAWAFDERAAVLVWDSGGAGRAGDNPLRSAKPTMFGPPRLAWHGITIGGELYSIPHVENEQQRIALALFREAKASNNDYLSLLFFWQVLEVAREAAQKVADRITAEPKKHPRLDRLFIDQLELGGRSLGTYLHEDCRNAIAHIRRHPGLKEIDLDLLEERTRITFSSRAAEALAETFIRDELGLTKKAILVRPRGGGFPRFVAADERSYSFVAVYPYRPRKFPRRIRGYRGYPRRRVPRVPK
ncbi:MAG: methylamine utilization protein MauJ [Thermoanaerobaculia bacterium]